MVHNSASPIILTNSPAAEDLTALQHGPMTIVLTTDPVCVEQKNPGRHEYYEFFYPVNTMQKLFVEDRSIDCHPGQVVPINPGQPHGFRRGNRAVSFIMIQFETVYLSGLMQDMQPSDPPEPGQGLPLMENAAFPVGSDLQSLGARLIREFDEQRPGRERLLHAMTDALAILLIRTCFGQRPAAPAVRQTLQSERYLRFRQVIEYMQNHLSDKITIDSLAEIAGMNRYHFIRTFRSAFSQSPYDYLTDLRIERASQLLQQNSLPAAEIASQCGFFSASRFSAAFKLATGMTPSQYRINSRSAQPESRN